MLHSITHRYFKRGLCCVVFLFTFLFSFSAYVDHQVHGKIDFDSKVNLDQINYSETSISCQGHLSESPENPFETGSDFEKENETDDDKDESSEHFYAGGLHYLPVNSSQTSFTFTNNLSTRVLVPFYILFHSWKSYLG